VLGIVLETVGEGRVRKAFDEAVKAIEARNDGGISAPPGT
jgi:hypothetical protein